MTYDTWKSTDPRDREYDPADRDYDDEPGEPEVTELMPSALQLEVEDLRARVDTARALVIAALHGAETGNGYVLLRLDNLLTGVLAQLGCAACGKRFDRGDASHLVCVRQHGVHAGDCGLGGGH